jgi:hypothetical protein
MNHSYFPPDFRPNPQKRGHSRVLRSYLDQKAELFAILQTARVIKREFDNGHIDSIVYLKNMQKFHRELTSLQRELKDRNSSLREIVAEFPIGSELKPMISFLTSIQDYKYDQCAKQWQVDPYSLAAWAAEATSKFITLSDYLQLITAVDLELLAQLFQDLEELLLNVAMFHPFADQLRRFRIGAIKHLSTANFKSIDSDQYRSVIKEMDDFVYTVFLEFKQIFQSK